MKKERKKLALHRETITRLTDDQLVEAAGATGFGCPTMGLTNCTCPTNNCDTIGQCVTQTGCVNTYRC